MPVQLASWADFGYRKLGPLPRRGGGSTAEQVAEVMSDRSDYQATSDHWVRRHARRKNAKFNECIQLVRVLDRDTPLDDMTLAFVDTHSKSEWMKLEREWFRFRSEPDFPAVAAQRAETLEDRWRGLYRLCQALFYAGPERLRPAFRDQVAPCFFRLYPQGKIVVLRYDTGVDDSAALLRVLYGMAQAPLGDWNGADFRGVQTLHNWHMTSLTRLMPALLDLFSHLFYPQVGGVCAGLFGLNFLFLLDPPERHAPACFPRNWLGFPGGSASFGKENADPVEIVRDFKGLAYHRAGHQRFCHQREFNADERLVLLRWYVQRVNRLLYELTDVANFTENHDAQAVVDPVFGFEHQLTVDRLLRKTLLAMSLDDAPTANLMAFEIADLYDTLSERFRNRRSGTPAALYQTTEFFKALFNTQEGPALMVSRFATLPPPFDRYLQDLAAQVYRRIEETVIESVWLKAKVTANAVLVRDKDLIGENPMPVPQFVAEVMRAYRNAHHGYFTAGDAKQSRPSRFLFPVNGNLPVEMSALPALWWLAYLADPGLVGWKHLEINAYD